MSAAKTLTAQDCMRRDLVTAHPDELLTDLRRRLVVAHISGVPVVESGKLVGIVSRSDIARVEEMLASFDGEVSDELGWNSQQADGFEHAPRRDYQGFRQRLEKLRVRDAMRTQVITCAPGTSLRQIAQDMVENHVHRIVVVEAGRPVGIVSTLDLARLMADGRLTEA